MARIPASTLLLIFVLALTGCFPSSCRRDEVRAVFPADSLSRQIAQQIAEDTLRLVWQAGVDEVPGLEHPRTVRFGPDGMLYITDTERHRIYVLDADGAFFREIASPDFRFPYLAGLRGDTLLVFNPEAQRIDFVHNGATVRSIETPADLPGSEPLQYVAASDSAIFFKVIAEDAEGYIARLSSQGEVEDTETLAGPYWRYAGLLRTWGDTLVSLSGYSPLVDIIAPGVRLDSLPLVGFDSPMLARRRLFQLGDVNEAPLLSSSAAAAGDLLFVLNLRAGWLRVDAYDHSGRLQHVLIQENPEYNQSYYPIDLDVRQVQGGYELAVVTASPEPMVSLFRWVR